MKYAIAGYGNWPIFRVARNFRVEAFLPPVDGLKEGLTASQLRRDDGGFGDRRFADQIGFIDQWVMRLPVYRQLHRSSL